MFNRRIRAKMFQKTFHDGGCTRWKVMRTLNIELCVPDSSVKNNRLCCENINIDCDWDNIEVSFGRCFQDVHRWPSRTCYETTRATDTYIPL